MGVYHFMGLGRSVGAVTCAVDYIEKCLSEEYNHKSTVQQMLGRTGGINHEEDKKGKIEAIVFFTSKELIIRDPNPDLKAYKYQGVDNPGVVRDELEKVLRKVWKTFDRGEGRKVFWCEVDIDNYQDCLLKIMKVTRRFSQQGKQGKEIWCNLTGGTNAINQALTSMSQLTGASLKSYLISQARDYREYVTVPPSIQIAPNQDSYFNIMPFYRMTLDTSKFYAVLENMEVGRQYEASELHGVLKARDFHFAQMETSYFTREYILKLYALGFTDRTGGEDNHSEKACISSKGQEFLQDLERYLGLEYALDDIEQSHTTIVEESKTWDWFTQTVI